MNRRIFLSLIGFSVPAVGMASSLLKSTSAQTVKKYPYFGNGGKFDILTPEEISQHWCYVSKPVVKVNGNAYATRTWILRPKIYATESDSAQFNAVCNGNVAKSIKDQVIFEIKRLQLTHVHMCAMVDYPIILPDWTYSYSIVVKGFRVRNVWYAPSGITRGCNA